MMMESSILHYLGVKDIPSFDHPTLTAKASRKTLGEACGGVNIARCQKFFNVNTEGLEAVACGICTVEITKHGN